MVRLAVVALISIVAGVSAGYAPSPGDGNYGNHNNGYGDHDNGYGNSGYGNNGYGNHGNGNHGNDNGYGNNGYGDHSNGYGNGYRQAPQPRPEYSPPTPEPTKAWVYTPKPTPPPAFQAPTEESYQSYKKKCSSTCKPNSAKYMAYVCSSLYAKAVEWSENKCRPYYAVANVYNSGSDYQAKLCTYWTHRSIASVVSSCFIEAHLRNEFIMKYGKDGPGIWYCRYSEFVNQVRECYSSSLKFYPLGEDLNSLEAEVAALYTPDNKMPPFEFHGASVAMCAYYNKDQVYNRVTYS